MFGHDANLDHLEDCQGEGHPPKDPSRRLHCCHVDVLVIKDVCQHFDYQTHKEENVRHYVVVVPKCEISFLKSPSIGFWTLKAPEEKGSPDVSEAVGGDEDGQEAVDPVDVGDGGLGDVAEDEADEADVGEGGVESPVEGNLPLFAEPGGGEVLVTLRREKTGVEEWIEEEKEIAGNL